MSLIWYRNNMEDNTSKKETRAQRTNGFSAVEVLFLDFEILITDNQNQDYIAFIEAKVADQTIADEIKIPIVFAQKAFCFSILKR